MGFVPDVLIWGILGIVGIGSLIWIILSVSIVQGVGRTNANKVVLALLLVPAPFVYFGMTSWHHKYKWEHARKMERELVAKTLLHLSRVCEVEEKFEAYLPFVREAGVFYRSTRKEDEKLDFGDQRLSEEPLPEKGFLNWWHDVQKWWYGDHFLPAIKEQFLYPVEWRHGLRGDSILRVLGAESFVEFGGGGGGGFIYTRTATRDWWRKDGRDGQLSKFLSHMSESDPRQEYIHYPIGDLKAKYELVVEDISTLEDRRNWIARGRLRLVDRRTSAIVAEYLGFSANVSPMRYTHNPPWNRIQVCPKAAQDSQSPGYEPWDAGRFFFSRLINDQAKQR